MNILGEVTVYSLSGSWGAGDMDRDRQILEGY